MPYVPHAHHRNGAYASAKSQWTITEADEISVYDNAVLQGWATTTCAWGLLVIGASPQFLGESQAPASHPVKIAKFVSDNNDWHGYPVAHWLRPWDKPALPILMAWNEAGLITRTTLSKIRRGKRCNL